MAEEPGNTNADNNYKLPDMVDVTLHAVAVTSEEQTQLWNAIRLHTEQIGFNRFRDFVDVALCGYSDSALSAGHRGPLNVSALRPGCNSFEGFVPGTDLYAFLKLASEIFLLLYCGTCPDAGALKKLKGLGASNGAPTPSPTAIFDNPRRGTSPLPEEDLIKVLTAFLGSDRYSLISSVVHNVYPGIERDKSPFCASAVTGGPCLLELLWSYWHEESMLVQTTNRIALRFQNVARSDRDPLAEFELSPLRPLSGFLWGYIQDETRRLSVMRRAYEYQHEYGLSLAGRAAAGMRPADSRSKFLQAFHDLMRLTDQFYREASDNTVTPDPFPLLIALRDLHMILAEGAHNQFRDLPWTARSEMLVQQWLLARSETRDFLRGRIMVPYPEEWMGAVDAMKRLQGWSDTNSIHFNDLARFGERLLLSVRHVRWDIIADPLAAQDWALAWRPEVQGYIHAYRMATGVMLADDIVELNRPDSPRYAQPSALLRGQLADQRRNVRSLPTPSVPNRLSLPARGRTTSQS